MKSVHKKYIASEFLYIVGNKMYCKKYHNAIFSAQHGSWNAVKPRGARVMVTYLDSKGNAVSNQSWLIHLHLIDRVIADVRFRVSSP